MFRHAESWTPLTSTSSGPAPLSNASPAASACYHSPELPTMGDALQVVLVHRQARLPQRASASAAGYDLFAAEAGAIEPWSHGAVSTGLAVRVPDGCYGRIAPRSSLAVRGLLVNAGVVDADYTGVVRVVLHNASIARYEYAVGDRVAQLVLERVATPPVLQVAALPETARAAGGFGSTGVGALAARDPL